ncbi:sigma-70 family RNA polymerase sigma factor [Burkholderia alba]|uniref:sigma-70 family RNA polymerase sigma factor n=1 Tax=Burkholderia alba TaxID=2683677 RepID=UPI002B055C1B|nr:sigma-70 family RNA polymerase sigma factor [Burkholderia alba]
MMEPQTDRHPPDPVESFESQRGRLLSLAHRMLGSRAEAEDVVQDAWLKWRLADTAGIRLPAAWLTTVATRLSIDRLRQRRSEHALREAGWLPEPWLDERAPSAEDVALRGAQLSYGLMLLLERLSPGERAAFLLHEAFDCDYADLAAILGKTEANCRQIVHRAKTRLQRSDRPPAPADPARQRRIVDDLRAAIGAQDRTALLRFLDEAHGVADSPAAARASLDVVGRAGATAERTFQAEAVSINGETGVALLVDGEIAALFAPSLGAHGQVALRVVTDPAALRAANRIFGRAAIARLLASIGARRARCPLALA